MLKIENIKKNYLFNTYGTSGMGYVEHRGITVTLSTGEIINAYYGYSSQGYGTFKEIKNQYSELNGRYNPKYDVYRLRVSNHFEDLFANLQKGMNKKSFKNKLDVKRFLRNPYNG